MGRYAACADVLRMLAAAEPVVLDGGNDPLRLVLRTAAEACEELERTERALSQARQIITEQADLLARAVDVLGTDPLPLDGGSWVVFELGQQIQRVLDQTSAARSSWVRGRL
jgi:hypothetical protein